MIARRALLSAAVAVAAAPQAVLAADAGAASGAYRDDGLNLPFRHAVAMLLDNAEGVQEHARTLRVLLSDVEAPPQVLHGLVFPPVRALARAGRIRGVLLEFDPADRNSLQATVLARPDDPNTFLPNLSLSNSAGLWSRLEVGAAQVSGELKPDEDGKLAATFTAPIFTDPVEADLKGPAAAASEPAKVLIARAEALAKGDLAAALSLTNDSMGEQLKAMPPGMLKQASAQIPALIKELKGARRVVIRRETAAVQGAHGDWMSLEKVDGAWKAAD